MKYLSLSIGFGLLIAIALHQPLQDFLSGNLLAASPDAARAEHVQHVKKSVAMRLANRLQRHNIDHPSIDVLIQAQEVRNELLTKSVEVTFSGQHGKTYQPWNISLTTYQQFISMNFSNTAADYYIDYEAIKSHLADHFIPGLTRPVDSILTSVATDSFGTQRAETIGVAKKGDSVDEIALATSIVNALKESRSEINVDVLRAQGVIVNNSGKHFPALTLLGNGKSNFAHSDWGRRQNVSLALNDRVHNVVVEPGEEFSFNSTLKGPVTIGRGWHMAKIIYRNELKDAPGGGICQGSTTVYRAILGAGLPVTKHQAHSKYVYYYEQGEFDTEDSVSAVGFDSAIFPPENVDLKFYNDTPGPILVQAETIGDDAYVSFYGVDDGRTVDFEGPYFDTNTPPDYYDVARGRDYLRTNEMAWTRTVTSADGTAHQSNLISRYDRIPHYVKTKYAEQGNLHASAE